MGVVLADGDVSTRRACRPLRLSRERHWNWTSDAFWALGGLGGWDRAEGFSGNDEIDVGALDCETDVRVRGLGAEWWKWARVGLRKDMGPVVRDVRRERESLERKGS